MHPSGLWTGGFACQEAYGQLLGGKASDESECQVEGNTIFVHAGIDEEAEEMWEWGTDEYTLTEKFPAQLGKFNCGKHDMKIVAGHVGTAVISQDRTFHDIYFDGESH